MPWKDSSVDRQRLELLLAAERGDAPVTVLCERAGVSRKTFYKVRGRWRAEGAAGLVTRSSTPGPRAQARAWPADWRAQVLRVRAELLRRGGTRGHGPRKIQAVLAREDPTATWPCAATIGRFLRQAQQTAPRKRRPTRWPTTAVLTPPTAPMHVVTLDFKGTLWLADGRGVAPLTVIDNASRLCLACVLLPANNTGEVGRILRRVFQRVGLPTVIRTDNGPPFASGGLAGLTPLSLGWWQQGIVVERITPGRPQQNGVHEHFHRSLKAAVDRTPAPSRRALQARCDAFVLFYNDERPHQALAQEPPRTVFAPSARPWRPPTRFTYAPDALTRAVRPNGYLPFEGHSYYVSETLHHQRLGLTAVGSRCWTLWLGPIPLAILDQQLGKLRPLSDELGPPGGAQFSPITR